MLLQTFLVTFFILFVAMAMFAVRVFILKKGEFKGGCASNNPILTNEIGECQVCGRKPDEECQGDENVKLAEN